MNKLPDPDSILDGFNEEYFVGECSGKWGFKRDEVIKAMKEYGRQIRDIALDWAVENSESYDLANLNSILLGKTSKDLEIEKY